MLVPAGFSQFNYCSVSAMTAAGLAKYCYIPPTAAAVIILYSLGQMFYSKDLRSNRHATLAVVPAPAAPCRQDGSWMYPQTWPDMCYYCKYDAILSQRANAPCGHGQNILINQVHFETTAVLDVRVVPREFAWEKSW